MATRPGPAASTCSSMQPQVEVSATRSTQLRQRRPPPQLASARAPRDALAGPLVVQAARRSLRASPGPPAPWPSRAPKAEPALPPSAGQAWPSPGGGAPLGAAALPPWLPRQGQATRCSRRSLLIMQNAVPGPNGVQSALATLEAYGKARGRPQMVVWQWFLHLSRTPASPCCDGPSKPHLRGAPV